MTDDPGSDDPVDSLDSVESVDPADPVEPSGADGAGDPAGRDPTDGNAPFASLVDRLDERERRRADADADDPFEAVDVDGFDGDVWAALDDASAEDGGSDGPAAGVGDDGRTAGERDGPAGGRADPTGALPDGAVDGEASAGEDDADDADDAGDDPSASAVGDERVVNKREYCQQCPHLAAPPEMACTREGTAIVEVLDGDDVRVRGCPMVERGGPT